jgi:dTDP-glucose pyrophosphorylase
MNVLVLMAGEGDAFRDAGYLYPKNLVEIDGLPLVQRVIDSLRPLLSHAEHRFIFLVPEEENRQYHTGDVIRLLVPDAVVVEVHKPTAGAACTALLAIEEMAAAEPLLIVNGDQVVDADLSVIITEFRERGLDGGIVVFEAVHPRWSYVKCDADGFVIETAEKRPISNLATAGIYWFARGADFLEAAMQSIKKDAHVGGNFYICPCYNEMLLKQSRIGIQRVLRDVYFSLAAPQGAHDYEEYLRARRNGAYPMVKSLAPQINN